MSSISKEEINQFLRNTIAELTGSPKLKTQLQEMDSVQESGLNSIMLVKLVVQIEMKYEIAFDDGELLVDNFRTIAAITQRIINKTGALI